jgi:hypothetical protein
MASWFAIPVRTRRSPLRWSKSQTDTLAVLQEAIDTAEATKAV